ncbi:1-phosphofructokinase [Wukongibacter baidiensis]|uniref:1-phosphofructokinase n=1 Tax=Wukongibacter baidiensis TaxID=1723361 RepID=UPI003D7F458E
MIATITLNPSVDKRYFVTDFQKDGVFRAKETQETAGGKGLNVARVIKSLDEPVITTGFIGGKNGQIIEEKLNELQIIDEFVKIEGETRNCIAILSDDSSQTEILESGPSISQKEIDKFLVRYDEILSKATILCASGSIPHNLPRDIYKELILRAKEYNVKFLLDTSGDGFKTGIESAPYLVKPNKEELEELTEISIESEEDIIISGKELLKKGIEIVVISLGGEGSIVFSRDNIFKVKLPNVTVVNPVGSGDSMIAGFAVALKRGYSIEKMIKFASATGTANAMEKETGKVSREIVMELMDKIKVEVISKR